MAVQPPARLVGPFPWSPCAVAGGPSPVAHLTLPELHPIFSSTAASAAGGDKRGWLAALWRWRPWKTVAPPPPPTPGPSVPPVHQLTTDLVRFADRTVTVDLSSIDYRVTVELRRDLLNHVQIARRTLTILIADPNMAARHATVHSIPERRLMVIHDHGSPHGTIMGGRKLFLEPQFVTLSPGSTGVTLRLADTTVVIGQPKHLAPSTGAAYDWRTGHTRTSMNVLTAAATEALRLSSTALQIEIHRLADETLMIHAVPAEGTEGPQWHGALDVSLPDEELDPSAFGALLSFVAGHFRIVRPVSEPTIHVAIEWLTPTAFTDRLGPWVMKEAIATTVRAEGLVIFLSRGKGDSTDGFDWVVRADGTAGALTDDDLTNREGHIPKVILLLPWHDLHRARTQLERTIARIRAHMAQAHLSETASRHVRQIFHATVGDFARTPT